MTYLEVWIRGFTLCPPIFTYIRTVFEERSRGSVFAFTLQSSLFPWCFLFPCCLLREWWQLSAMIVFRDVTVHRGVSGLTEKANSSAGNELAMTKADFHENWRNNMIAKQHSSITTFLPLVFFELFHLKWILWRCLQIRL